VGTPNNSNSKQFLQYTDYSQQRDHTSYFLSTLVVQLEQLVECVSVRPDNPDNNF